MAKVSFGNGFANMMLLRMKKKVTKQKEEIKEKQEEDVKREQLRALEEAALTAQQQNVMASTVLALAGDRMVPTQKPKVFFAIPHILSRCLLYRPTLCFIFFLLYA